QIVHRNLSHCLIKFICFDVYGGGQVIANRQKIFHGHKCNYGSEKNKIFLLYLPGSTPPNVKNRKRFVNSRRNRITLRFKNTMVMHFNKQYILPIAALCLFSFSACQNTGGDDSTAEATISDTTAELGIRPVGSSPEYPDAVLKVKDIKSEVI